MKDQLDRLESKVDKTIDAVSEVGLAVARMEVYVEKNTEDLEEHIEGVKKATIRIERLEKIEQWMRGAFYIVLGFGTLALSALKLFDK